VMVSRRVVGEGRRRRFLTEIHEQHPVVDRIHKALECPGFKAPCMIRTGQTKWPDPKEWDTLGDSGKRWAAGTVL
jgi:hypothetical protein